LLRSIVDIVSITRDYMPRSLYYCLFAPHTYIFVLRMHPVRGETQSKQQQRRGCNNANKIGF